jgi:hypothetical protein
MLAAGTEGDLAMTAPTITWDDIFSRDISDETLENAGGMSATAEAGSSLYSSYDASGCTC